jgi:hypothetical protein
VAALVVTWPSAAARNSQSFAAVFGGLAIQFLTRHGDAVGRRSRHFVPIQLGLEQVFRCPFRDLQFMRIGMGREATSILPESWPVRAELEVLLAEGVDCG